MTRLGLIWPLLLATLWLGACTRTETDPDYAAAQQSLQALKQQTWVADSRPALEAIYQKIAPGQPLPDTLFRLTQSPYKLLYRAQDIEDHVLTLLEERRVVFNGVTGSGKTTECRFIGKLLAGDPNRFYETKFDPRKRYEDFIYNPDTKSPGEFIRWLRRAEADPANRYVFFMDEINTADPYVIFGSDVINLLENPDETVTVQGLGTLRLPPNFYVISAMKRVGKDVLVFDDALFRRLGREIRSNPDPQILAKNLEAKTGIPDSHKVKLVYCFTKFNQLIASRIGPDYQIGEWGTVKSSLKPQQFEDFKAAFLGHLNAFAESKGRIQPHELDSLVLLYAHGGVVEHNLLKEGASGVWHFLTSGNNLEIIMAVLALLGAIVGRYLLTRRKRLRKRLNARVEEAEKAVKTKAPDAERRLDDLLADLEALVLKGRLEPADAAHFTTRLNRYKLEITMQKRFHRTSGNLRQLIDQSLENNRISGAEMNAIRQALAQEKVLNAEEKEQLLQQLHKFYEHDAAHHANHPHAKRNMHNTGAMAASAFTPYTVQPPDAPHTPPPANGPQPPGGLRPAEDRE